MSDLKMSYNDYIKNKPLYYYVDLDTLEEDLLYHRVACSKDLREGIQFTIDYTFYMNKDSYNRLQKDLFDLKNRFVTTNEFKTEEVEDTEEDFKEYMGPHGIKCKFIKVDND